jgi:hypothetical protein
MDMKRAPPGLDLDYWNLPAASRTLIERQRRSEEQAAVDRQVARSREAIQRSYELLAKFDALATLQKQWIGR